jgi:ribosomal protein S18 acetylase RimI-like enzyme
MKLFKKRKLLLIIISVLFMSLLGLSARWAGYFFKHICPVTVQLATVDEAEEVEHVLVRSVKDAYSKFMSKETYEELITTRVLYNSLNHFRKSIQSDKSHIVVAKLENRIVGYILTHKFNEESLFIEHLFILPEYYRQGIGKQLVNHSVAVFKEEAPTINQVFVNTRKQNKRSQTFYYKMGFYKVNEYPEKDYIMMLLLKKV